MGREFLGWQKQSQSFNTVQGILEKAINKVSKDALINSIGSGRTDTGVHALGQVVRVEMKSDYPLDMFTKGVNNFLPPSIRILEVEHCDQNFHPVFNSKKKVYKYVIGSLPTRPFLDGLFLYYPYELNEELLKKGAKAFEGKYDFCNYFCTGTDVTSTTRKIFSCEFSKVSYVDLGFNQIYGDFYEFRIEGEGFLKQMVRLIVGALLSLNEGRVDLQDIRTSLQVPLRQKLGPTAPPDGLYLDRVDY
tara:strand:+ start:4206 stop:4946 length:741 start_codon:yes stop_codon:yes gene_type:complete